MLKTKSSLGEESNWEVAKNLEITQGLGHLTSTTIHSITSPEGKRRQCDIEGQKCVLL